MGQFAERLWVIWALRYVCLLSGSLLLMVGPVQYFIFRSLGAVGLIMEISACVGAILVLTGFFRGSYVHTLPKWLPILVLSIFGVFGYFVIGCL